MSLEFIRKKYNEEYHSLWRASANEGVSGERDYPEALLVYPEWLDGALMQGAATQVHTFFDLTDPKKCILRVTDNGQGIRQEQRLLRWTSETNTDNIHHRYGHGSKKCLTKFAPDYETAQWKIVWRNSDKRGVSGSLKYVTTPFRSKMEIIEDEKDEEVLMPNGTLWEVEFDKSVLQNCGQSVESLFIAVKEIITTRYSKVYFDKCEFILEIRGLNSDNAPVNIYETSRVNKWITLEQSLQMESHINLQYDLTVPFGNGSFTYRLYYLNIDGRWQYPTKALFPVYGQKNMKASRIHIALDGRYIEARPYHKFIGKPTPHNDDNGYIGFVDFHPDTVDDIYNFPTPNTTKVQFQEHCPNHKAFMELLKSEIKREDERRALELAQREKERLEKERKLKKEKERQEKERREKERIEAEKRRNEEKERQRLVTPNSDEITIHKVVKKKKHVTSEPDVIPIPKIIDESVTNQLIPLQQTEPVSEVVSSIPEPVPDLPKFVSDNKVCEKSVVVPDNQLDMENRDMMQDLINRLAEMPCEQRNEALKKILKNMCN